MTLDQLFPILCICVVAAPTALLALLGVTAVVGRRLSERTISRCTQIAVVGGLLAALTILGLMLWSGRRLVPIDFGNWVVLHGEHIHFTLKFEFDRLSVPFVILTFLLVGTIGAFASVYLHREPGFHRFFVFYAVFLLGMIVTSTAGTVETLFAGWELVGLSSALLVAYFHERTAPVRNGLRVWMVYRISDAALLVAALTLHHLTGEGDFTRLMGSQSWPDSHANISPDHALYVGLLFLLAAAGKSALIPFSGWLPRAMEGPTPSSAVFYGALSVHLGAFLLLRISPLLELSPLLCGIVIAWGLTTALYAAITARVQTDVKSMLAFASLTQVGIIVAEIGCGLRYIALIHIIGHAFMRTLQLLRAPTLLRDYHLLENAIGDNLPHGPTIWERLLPARTRTWLYRLALERGYWDSLLSEYVVRPFLWVFHRCDAAERVWTDWLSGGVSRESDRVKPHPEALRDLE